MRVLMISTDRNIFEKESDVRRRMCAYGDLVESLEVILYATEAHGVPAYEELSPRVRVFATRSKSKWRYITDAIRIGKTLPRPDVITVQDPAETGLAGRALATHFGTKLEIQMHGDIFGKEFRKESLLNWVRMRIARRTLPRADGIRVVSERIWKHAEHELGKRLIGKKHTVLPIFVDGSQIAGAPITTDVRALFPQFGYRVLMVSRLEREKNIELGIDAFKEMLIQIPDAGLIIVGDGSCRKQLEERVMRLGLQKSVVFLGWRKDVASLYKTADTYLLTSNHEGYARTLVEAAFAKCPIVTTDVGIAGDVLRHGESALVAKPEDADMLAGHLVWLAGDPTLHARLAEEAYRSITAHVPKSEREYLEAYKRLWEECVY